MTPPKISAYVFGNPITLLASYAATGFLIYRTIYIGDVSWIAVIIAFAFASYCTNCSSQITAYRSWKREWDAMGGIAPKPSLFVRAPWLMAVLGYGLWVFLMWSAPLLVPDYRAAIAAWFWIGNLLFVVFIAFKLLRNRKRRPPPIKNVQVSLCLPVSQKSVHVRQTYGALPDYCQQLFRRGY